jgi:hypothetical protein
MTKKPPSRVERMYGKSFGTPPKGEKEKPLPGIVKKAAVLIKDPKRATARDIQSMAARILDDQKNDPEPHKSARKPKTR